MNSGARALFWIFSSILMLFSICELSFFSDVYGGTYWTIVHSILSLTWILIFFKFSKVQFKYSLSFSTGFILCLSIFHLSFVYLDAFNVYDLNEFFLSKTGQKYRMASSAVLLAFSSFGFGLLIKTKSRSRTENHLSQPITIDAKKQIYSVGIILLFFAFVGFMMTIFAVGNIFSYSRQDIFKGIGDTRGFGLFLMTFPTSLMFLFIGARTIFIKNITYPLVFFGGLFLLFLGYRSNLFFPATVGACLWLKSGRKIPKSVFISLIIASLVIIPAVKYIRTMGQYSSINYDDINKSVEKVESAETFLELGAILGLLSKVMDLIPTEYPYKYGLTYIKAMQVAIPNIGFSSSKSNREIIKGLSDQEIYEVLKPSEWYTYKVSKWMFYNGGGSGFSMLAEAYMNFGYFGFFFVFFILGMLFSNFDSKNISAAPMTIIYISLIIWPLYYGVRNEISTIIKVCSFNMIIVFSANKLGILSFIKRIMN